jgi:hypothetical protein
MGVDTATTGPGAGFTSSPLTLLIFGTLAGYYVTYAIGLLSWQRRVRAENGTGTKSPVAPLPTAGDDA